MLMLVGGQGTADVHVHQQFADEPGEILACGHTADGAGEHVIEHQSGDAELGEGATESAFDGAIHAAADEHAAAFHVHRANGVRENHDGQDEPGSSLADVGFGFAARVIGGGGQVVQYDGGGAPERDECQERRGRNNDTRDPCTPATCSSRGIRNRTHEWISIYPRLKSSHFSGVKSSGRALYGTIKKSII